MFLSLVVVLHDLIAILLWRYSKLLLEYAREVVGILKTDVVSDFAY